MESPRNADLATDIIRDILLRLPVKILSQFKCVCKEWYTLIGSQSFVNEHFVNDSNQERLLVFRPDYDRLIYVDESLSEYEEPDHLPMPGKVRDVMGPVNGVFCLVSRSGRMGLLNPGLRQFKPLPLISSCYNSYFLGFGLDPLSGYYKVVSIQVMVKLFYSPPIVHLYNSGTDSWRRVEDVDMLCPLRGKLRSKSNTYLNGVYYWVVYWSPNDFGLLALDMSSDKFRMIQIPDVVEHHLRLDNDYELEFEVQLVVHGDSLAILSFIDAHDPDGNFIDMWVLGNDGRWTKRSTFGPIVDLTRPVGFWKNNGLMLETCTSILSLYNVFTRELRRVEAIGDVDGLTLYVRNWVFTYKESLVSMKGDCKFWDISSAFVNDFFKVPAFNLRTISSLMCV